jgi:polyketide synthase PksM
VKGLSFDWLQLYPSGTPRTLPLPTYPFAREVHWLPVPVQPEAPRAASPGARSAALHPLLHENTSDLDGLRFSSRFDGSEFFLDQHRIGDSRVLPAVAYLEMLRVATERAANLAALRAERQDGERLGVSIRDVAWLRPIVVDAGKKIDVRLQLTDAGEIAFEVHGESEDEWSLHCRGRASIVSEAAPERLDIAALRAKSVSRIEGEDCYAMYAAAGLHYGPAYRTLTTLWRGAIDGRPFVMAELVRTDTESDTESDFVLHPGVMDGALQASSGFSFDEASPRTGGALLPFALDELRIVAGTPGRGFARVMQANVGSKYDIDICDEQGNVCVALRGFVARPIDGAQREPAGASQMDAQRTIQLAPRWDAVVDASDPSVCDPTERMVVIGGTAPQHAVLRETQHDLHVLQIGPDDPIGTIAQALSAAGPIAHVVWLAPSRQIEWCGDDVILAQREGVRLGFRLTKALLQLGYGTRRLRWTVATWAAQSVVDGDRVQPAHASIHGFIGSLAKEYPTWLVRLGDLPAGDDRSLQALLAVRPLDRGDAWALRRGEWFRQTLVQVEQAPAASVTLPYRDRGVYVVIGGAGGLGEVFSEHLIRRHGARMVWIGRRAADEEIASRLDRLAQFGPRPTYIAADAADRDALEAARLQIVASYGRVDGVIHAALELRDKSLMNMDEADFMRSLVAKIDVSVRMAQVFGRDTLDFALFFSSFQSFSRAAGQSNYAAGCAFKDAFADAARGHWACPVKIVNWGYWGEIGSVANDFYRERMAQVGVGSIRADEGMSALDALMGGRLPQIALIKTTQWGALSESVAPELLRVLAGPEAPPAIEARPAPADEPAESDRLLAQLLFVQLRSMGAFDAGSAPDPVALEQWRRRSGVLEIY